MTDFDDTPKHQFLIKKNGLRRYIVSTYLAILIYAVTSLFRDFADVTGSDFLKKRYHQIRVQQVRFSRKRHFICLCRTILILAAILTQEPQKIACMIINKTESYQKISLILIANITAVRVPHTKNVKNGRPDVIKMRFPYTEKNYTGPWPRDYLCDISSNRPSRLGCSKLSQTDRQKHTQTDRKTHRQTTMVHPKIFSHFE